MPVPLEIGTKRPAYRRSLALTGGLAVVFGIVAIVGDLARWERLAMAATALVCGAIAVLGARTLRSGAPLLVLRDEGIEHRALGLTPWDDVGEVRVFVSGGNEMLGVDLRDADRYVARIPSWPMRLLARLNPLFRHPTLSLPLGYVELSAEELIAEMEARARRPLGPGHRSDMSGV